MDFKVKPWAHQLEGIRRALPQKSYGFFYEQGTGKTGTIINTLRYKFQEAGKILPTVIYGPPIIVENWCDEWQMHSKLSKYDVVPLVGSGEKRLNTFTKGAYDKNGNALTKVFVTNYESLLMKPLMSAIKKWEPKALVFDECHRLKNYKAKRSKEADTLANPIATPRPLVYLSSGTPILNSPMDIFQQYLIMDGGKTFGRNFFAFRGKYFRDRNSGMPKDRYFPKWEVMTTEKDGFDALGEISRLLALSSMRVLAKDCLDLPPEIDQIIKVGMTPDQSRMYKEMKNEFITFLGDKACTANIALTKALRLMQIASGFVSVKSQDEEENGPVLHSIKETPKTQALKAMLEDLTPNHKVLVWAVWKENYGQIRQVCEELGIESVEVHGGISPNKKQEAIFDFKNDPKKRVYIGHPGSGGIGVNLVVAPYDITYSRTFSLEYWSQARKRNHRGGSEIHEKVTHYNLVCENTIDELVVKKLALKIEIGDKMLGDLSRELLEQDET